MAAILPNNTSAADIYKEDVMSMFDKDTSSTALVAEAIKGIVREMMVGHGMKGEINISVEPNLHLHGLSSSDLFKQINGSVKIHMDLDYTLTRKD